MAKVTGKSRHRLPWKHSTFGSGAQSGFVIPFLSAFRLRLCPPGRTQVCPSVPSAQAAGGPALGAWQGDAGSMAPASPEGYQGKGILGCFGISHQWSRVRRRRRKQGSSSREWQEGKGQGGSAQDWGPGRHRRAGRAGSTHDAGPSTSCIPVPASPSSSQSQHPPPHPSPSNLPIPVPASPPIPVPASSPASLPLSPPASPSIPEPFLLPASQ